MLTPLRAAQLALRAREPSPPVLDAYRTTDGPLKVWCAHEHTWHTHGACLGPRSGCPHGRRPMDGVKCVCPPGSGDGHRVAHCPCRRSPYRDLGYVIREVGPFTAAVRKAHGRPRRNYNRCPAVECKGEVF